MAPPRKPQISETLVLAGVAYPNVPAKTNWREARGACRDGDTVGVISPELWRRAAKMAFMMTENYRLRAREIKYAL